MLQIKHINSVTSTMDAAKKMLHSGAVVFNVDGVPNIAGIMADEQTAGRGQRGRAWHCPTGQSLCITYFFRHGLQFPDDIPKLSLLTGVAAAEGIEKLSPQCKIGLKWPNDLAIGGKKTGGILIETLLAPDGAWTALIGVGINNTVRVFPDELQHSATSLALNSVTDVSVNELAQTIGHALIRCAQNSFEQILSDWRIRDRTIGISFFAETPDGSKRGVAEGIDNDGRLLLRMEEGDVISVESASSFRSDLNKRSLSS